MSTADKIVGGRTINTDRGDKAGRDLAYAEKVVVVTRDRDELRLPKVNGSTDFAFAREDFFFAYPNNYKYYVNFYKDTFQHGGVSMEEMIIPLVELAPK